MSKSAYYSTCLHLFGRSTLFGVFDEGRKIFRLPVFAVFDVFETVESRRSRRIDSVGVCCIPTWRYYAVEFSIETAIVVAEIYFKNGEWKFNAVAAGYQGGLEATARLPRGLCRP